MKKLVFVVAVAVAASMSFAQVIVGGQASAPPRFPGMSSGPMTMLLMDPKVSNELKLTDDQRGKLKAVGEGIQTDMQKAYQDSAGDPNKMQELSVAVMDKAAKSQMDVLTVDQQKRLEEIFIQDNGVEAILNKDVQKDLGLKPEQTKKIANLQVNLAKATRSLGEKLQTGVLDNARCQELLQKNGKILDDELNKVMTEDQKKQLKSMEGKPFSRA